MSARTGIAAVAVAALLLCVSPAAAEVSFIPLPEILTDPNEGDTYGFLPVFLVLDEQSHIRVILAPDVRYNQITGVFPAFRLFAYPSSTRRYFVVLRKSTEIDEDYEVELEDVGLWENRLWLRGNFLFEQDSTERFYGFGNESSEDDETNYTLDQRRFTLLATLRMTSALRLGWRLRVRDVDVERGGVDTLPFTGDVFDVPGLDGATLVGQRLAVTYDSRDSRDIPTRGTLADFTAEVVDRAFGSDVSYVRYGTDVRTFLPMRLIGYPSVVALRGVLEYLDGGDQVPFFEQSILGGKRSLRGFGSGRFTDRHRFFTAAELRTRVYERRLFDVRAELEVAPFVEAGQVFSSVSRIPIDDLHFVGGIGFRGVVRPQVVGFVDIGVGTEGPSAFTGLGYPF